ncbi:MAG: methionyl-tRNA formyltransferase [Kiritimatiellae bacterium]|nr:methionyl-tRNA formyltransferase [Kiritimatiellia bacterium]
MRVVFMGSSAASAECLHALLREAALDVVGVVTQPDRPVGRGKVLTPCPLARYAAERGLGDRIIKPEDVNADEPMAAIRAWRPDVVAVVAYGQLLKKPLLDLPLFGCVNCHFSLLPKYRGAAPVVAALAAGERLTGVTVMHMGVGLDDGPIMLQSFEPIYPDTTGGALMCDLATAGGVALAKALRLMSDNALPPEVPQDGHFATYAKKLKKSDGLIDWDLPVITIERRIRAYNPWPGCYTFLPERLRRRGTDGRLVVLRARIVRLEPGWADAAPGTVLALDKAGPVVKCHDTALLLLEVKPEGGSAMDGASFLRGRPLRPFEDVMLGG